MGLDQVLGARTLLGWLLVGPVHPISGPVWPSEVEILLSSGECGFQMISRGFMPL